MKLEEWEKIIKRNTQFKQRLSYNGLMQTYTDLLDQPTTYSGTTSSRSLTRGDQMKLRGIVLSRDLSDLNDHELEVLSQSVRETKDARQKKFMSQFYAGMPIAITTASGKTYPAYIYKTKKASIDYKYTVDENYVESYQSMRTVTEKDLRTWVEVGYINPANPSTFEGGDAYNFEVVTTG